MLPNTAIPLSEFIPPPEPQHKPEMPTKPVCPRMICRATFDTRMATILTLEGKAALKALLKLNRELLPYVSREQEKMWQELSGVFIKKRGGGDGKA